MIRFTRRAEDDLIEVWLHITGDNVRAADAELDRIERRCRQLDEHPHSGPARPDIRPDLRYSPVGRRLIFYRIVSDGVEIVRCVDAARLLDPSMFGG